MRWVGWNVRSRAGQSKNFKRHDHWKIRTQVTSHFVAESDNTTPVMPPAIETSRVSTNCCRINVIFRAPSALGTAISFCRAAEPSDLFTISSASLFEQDCLIAFDALGGTESD
jgi:hypothetical protein